MKHDSHFRNAVVLGVAIVATTLGSAGARAQDAASWPDHTVELISNNSPGGATDILLRELAEGAKEITGQEFVVINRPGGNGATQMSAIAAAKPDGYTLGAVTLTHLTNMMTSLKGTFDESDFSNIVGLQTESHLLVVNADSPFQTFEQLHDAVAARGEPLVLAGAGAVNSAASIGAILSVKGAGVPFSWVSHQTSSEAMTAALGGHAEAAIALPSTAREFVDSGRMRALAVIGPESLPAYPGVKTVQDMGYDVFGDWQMYRGIYGPAGIPDDLRNRIADVLIEATESDRYQKYVETRGFTPSRVRPAEFDKMATDLKGLAETAMIEAGILPAK
ncbi:tripartite tricarboxylate transporter substrate binding protein [Salipiger sp.]|uniref:tripartite tricarboxylate transporter substrate binding protein n=1 Tax=Salipiger sp. TaxID=2078585 RepID=UPI003A9822B0